MKYSFPRWFPYLLLAVMVATFGVCAAAALRSGLICGRDGYIVVGLIGGAVFMFLVWSFLYSARYGVKVGSEGVSITGVFRTHAIPLSSIAQVVTASAPRSGTASWLLDKNDACLAKLAGSLVGFDALLAELGGALRPYQTLFYRRETWGPWEMQVAGDKKWVQSEPPLLVRKNSRRMTKILAVGFLLIILAAWIVAWR